MILVSFETVNSLCILAVSSSGKSLLFVIAISFLVTMPQKYKDFLKLARKSTKKNTKYKIQNYKKREMGLEL